MRFSFQKNTVCGRQSPVQRRKIMNKEKNLKKSLIIFFGYGMILIAMKFNGG